MVRFGTLIAAMLLLSFVAPVLIEFAIDIASSVRSARANRSWSLLGQTVLEDANHLRLNLTRYLHMFGWLMPTQWPLWMLAGVGVSCGAALALLVLPSTRAKLRVRAALIGRAWVYSFAWMVFPFAGSVLWLAVWHVSRKYNSNWIWQYRASFSDAFPWERPQSIMSSVGMLWPTIVWLWSMWYWWVALRTGLAIRGSRGVVFVVLFIGALLGVVCTLVSPASLVGLM